MYVFFNLLVVNEGFFYIVCWEIIDKIVVEWIILYFFVSVLYILKYENIFFNFYVVVRLKFMF